MTGSRMKTLAAAALSGVLLLGALAPAHGNGNDAVAAYESRNYREALRLFRPRAERGDAEAQYYLGLMYEKGNGVSKDQERMRSWYQRAADGGHARAQYKLAIGYAFGLGGLAQSDEDAAKWLQRSAENGYKRAQKNLARAYADGRFGLPRDPKLAEYWSKKAAS